MAAAAVRSAAAGAAELAEATAMGGLAEAIANDGADRPAGASGAEAGPPGKAAAAATPRAPKPTTRVSAKRVPRNPAGGALRCRKLYSGQTLWPPRWVTVDRSSGQVTSGPAACSALRQGCLATELGAEGPCVAGLSFATIVAVGERLIRRKDAGPFARSNPGQSRGVDPR